MMFFDFVFDAVVLFLKSRFFSLWFPPLFCLFFIALCPVLIRKLISWR